MDTDIWDVIMIFINLASIHTVT